jgi:type I restriction enzyme M protein
MGIVLPEGVFGNRGEAYVWDWLRAQGRVYALLDCPRTTFQPGTDTKTNVLFFRRAEASRPRQRPRARAATTAAAAPTRVGVALHCGHDRRGRARLPDGRPHPDDFEELAKDFHRRAPARWRDVSLDGARYLVPRYHAPRPPLSGDEAALTRGAPRATLGELRDAGLVTVRKGHEVGSQAYGTGDVPFIRTSDVANFEVSADPTKSVSEEVYARFAPQQRLSPGDVLLVVDGRYRIGQAAILDGSAGAQRCRCVVQSHFRILGTPKKAELDPYELLFALSLPSVRTRMRDLVFVQSTLGTLGERLFELPLPVLHGDGPWREAVVAFRRTLAERGRLLAKLRAMTAEAPEL